MDRYTVRKVVNDLVDRLMCEGMNASEILELIELEDDELEYFDLGWMQTLRSTGKDD